MSALHGVWITSIVGALLFWLAGYLMARGRGSKAEHTSADLQQRLAAQGQETAALTAERDQLAQELAVLGGQADSVKDERDRLEKQTLDQHNRLATVEEEREALRQETTGFTSRIVAAESERDQLRQEMVQLKKVLYASKDEREQLKSELTHMKVRARSAEEEALQVTAELTRVRQELSEFSSQRETREVQEVTEDTQVGTNLRAALLQSEEKRRNLLEQLQRSESFEANLAQRLKKNENSLAEAHQEIGALQVDLLRGKEKLQAAVSEVKLKTSRMAKLEAELRQASGGGMGELETTPGGTGMPLTRKTLSLLLERTRALQTDLKAANEANKKLDSEAKRRVKLEQLLTAMKARLVSTEERLQEIETDRDRLVARARAMADKRTLPGGFDGP